MSPQNFCLNVGQLSPLDPPRDVAERVAPVNQFQKFAGLRLKPNRLDADCPCVVHTAKVSSASALDTPQGFHKSLQGFLGDASSSAVSKLSRLQIPKKQASQLFQRPKKLMQKTQCHLLPLHQTPAQWCTPTRQFQPGLGCEAPESGHANIAWQDPPSIANMANIANMDCIDYRSANRIACWLLINVVNEKYTMQYVA